MPVQVCVLTSVHQPFDGRIYHRECKTLAQADYRVTLIAPADFESQNLASISLLGVKRPSTRFQRPRVWWQLYRRVCELRPDVVHLHDPELLLLAPLLRLRLGRGLKIVYDVHEYFVDSFADKHWIPRRLRPLAASLARWSERLLSRGVDGIVCAVEGQRPLYSGFRGPIAVVRNLPLASLFEGVQPHPALDVEGLRLIYAGLILPRRGIDVLVEAMRLLRQQGYQDVYLFLAGPDTSPAYRREIEAFVQTHQLAEQIRWLGYVPHDQVKHYLANADVGLVPGLRTHQTSRPSLSTKLFEYMLSALPVVAADHAYHRVYIEECDCGRIVPTTDADALAEAIVWLRDHPDQARAMGQRGREMVLARYTWEQEQSHLLAFYQTLLTEAQPG
jgi:glycosyltransferase involved in cell wall biosynthesis